MKPPASTRVRLLFGARDRAPNRRAAGEYIAHRHSVNRNIVNQRSLGDASRHRKVHHVTRSTTPADATLSIHVRALIRWLGIFPLVTIALTAIGPFTAGSPLVLRAWVLTVVIVPMAVYVVIPRLLSLYGRHVPPRR